MASEMLSSAPALTTGIRLEGLRVELRAFPETGRAQLFFEDLRQGQTGGYLFDISSDDLARFMGAAEGFAKSATRLFEEATRVEASRIWDEAKGIHDAGPEAGRHPDEPGECVGLAVAEDEQGVEHLLAIEGTKGHKLPVTARLSDGRIRRYQWRRVPELVSAYGYAPVGEWEAPTFTLEGTFDAGKPGSVEMRPALRSVPLIESTERPQS